MDVFTIELKGNDYDICPVRYCQTCKHETVHGASVHEGRYWLCCRVCYRLIKTDTL